MAKARGKWSMGYRLKKDRTVGNGLPGSGYDLWRNDWNVPGELFLITIKHSDRWHIEVIFDGYLLSGSGETERKARINFKNRVVILESYLELLKKKARVVS